MAKASKNKQKGFEKNIKKNRKENFNGTPTFITMKCCQKEAQPNCYMIELQIMIQKMNNQNESVHSF
jgi:protein-disulfide isomerase